MTRYLTLALYAVPLIAVVAAAATWLAFAWADCRNEHGIGFCLWVLGGR